eukprot:36846-Pelagomonas_calceolata.AAC.7
MQHLKRFNTRHNACPHRTQRRKLLGYQRWMKSPQQSTAENFKMQTGKRVKLGYAKGVHLSRPMSTPFLGFSSG